MKVIAESERRDDTASRLKFWSEWCRDCSLVRAP